MPIASGSSFGPGGRAADEALSVAGAAQTLMMLLGVLAVTSEYRHGSIRPRLLVIAQRTPGASAPGKFLTPIMRDCSCFHRFQGCIWRSQALLGLRL